MLVSTKKELARQVTELEAIGDKLKELKGVEESRLEGMDEDSPKYEELTGELELLDTAIEAAEDLGLELQVIVDGD